MTTTSDETHSAGDSAEERREENRKALLDQVEKRIEADVDSRKSSEARAIAIISLNLGVATLYFALRSQTGLWATAISDPAKVLLVIATVLEFVSLVIAVTAILPSKLKLLETEDYRTIRRSVNTSPTGMSRFNDEILETRIEQLGTISEVATTKAKRTVTSVIFFAGAVAAFVAAAIVSVWPTGP